MPFQVSPGVNVTEIDLTTVVPAVSTTEGAIAGVFRWGPVGKRVLVDSEAVLASRFGKPTNHNPETFFSAANFLSYGNKLFVARAANTTSTDTTVLSRNAVANVAEITNFGNTESDAAAYVVKSDDHYDTIADFADGDVLYIAKYPGKLGNSLKISVCDSANAYLLEYNLANNGSAGVIDTSIVNTNASFVVGSNSASVAVTYDTGTIANAYAWAEGIRSRINAGDYIEAGNSSVGIQYLKVTAVSAITNNTPTSSFTISFENEFQLSQNVAVQTLIRRWGHFNVVDRAPGTSAYQAEFGSNTTVIDEVHIVVEDEDGEFTGVPGTVLEVFEGLSRNTDAKTEDGAANYYKTVINQNSNYIWWANDRSGALSGNTSLSSANTEPLYLSFDNGTDGLDESTISLTNILSSYDLFASSEDVDISLILTGTNRGGTHGEQLANYLIDNIAEKRKDCVVFVSPQKADVVNNIGDESTDIVAFRNALRSTSYAVLDSGYKYQYDRYNDVYRWVPLNGDIAGLCVRTDDLRDAWFSPAGFNRGQIRNIIKLAYNPRQADRDILYKAGINPVVTFPGQGTVLYGDKTLLSKPSAFDRINVRRLFIVLEKAIATAAKFTLFEFNDEFTRAQFRNLVEPFLRDVQGRRGIYDFRVVCDTTNNTGEIIDRNEFVGDIYIKPARSINFIQLNFIAVRTGVEFSEVVGQF